MSSKTRIVIYIIIAILLAIIITFRDLIRHPGRSVKVVTRSTLNSMSNICVKLHEYKKDCGKYPSKEEGLSALLINPGQTNWNGPYMKHGIPLDALGCEYKYSVLSNGEINVVSSGIDRKYGTDDDLCIVVCRPGGGVYGKPDGENGGKQTNSAGNTQTRRNEAKNRVFDILPVANGFCKITFNIMDKDAQGYVVVIGINTTNDIYEIQEKMTRTYDIHGRKIRREGINSTRSECRDSEVDIPDSGNACVFYRQGLGNNIGPSEVLKTHFQDCGG